MQVRLLGEDAAFEKMAQDALKQSFQAFRDCFWASSQCFITLLKIFFKAAFNIF